MDEVGNHGGGASALLKKKRRKKRRVGDDLRTAESASDILEVTNHHSGQGEDGEKEGEERPKRRRKVNEECEKEEKAEEADRKSPSEVRKGEQLPSVKRRKRKPAAGDAAGVHEAGAQTSRVDSRAERRPSASGSANVTRRPTLSVAVPGSVVANAQGRELRTYVAGQLARAMAVFSVDEVVVFRDYVGPSSRIRDGTEWREWDACTFLARLLQYLETPQYLRKELFPVSSDLRFAGVLNPLDTPHHMRMHEARRFRDGAVVDAVDGGRSRVNIGLAKDVIVDRALQPGVRVTCELTSGQRKSGGGVAQLVSRSAPVSSGLYWGYSVRMAEGLRDVISECPYEAGYDLIIGTSERGSPIAAFRPPTSASHVLVLFGGPDGLEAALAADSGARDAAALCHAYLNTCPDQGSRTIRTEEAVLISLAALQPALRLLAGRE